MAAKQAKAQATKDFTWARACRDIVTAAINKGQLPSLAVSAVVLLFVWRLPESELARLANRVLDHLRDGAYVGYALFVILGAAFVVYVVRTKRLIHRLSDDPARITETGSK